MKIITKLLKHKTRWFGLSLLAVDIALFGFTDPEKVASSLLIVAFLLLCANIFFAVFASLSLASKSGFVINAPQRKAGFIGAGMLSLLVALQSIGQLTVRDIAVVIPFVVLGFVYITYGKTSPQP